MNESFNHERLTFTPKNRNFEKHWEERAKLAGLLHNLTHQELVKRIFSKNGNGVTNANTENCQLLDKYKMQAANLDKKRKFKVKKNRKSTAMDYISYDDSTNSK